MLVTRVKACLVHYLKRTSKLLQQIVNGFKYQSPSQSWAGLNKYIQLNKEMKTQLILKPISTIYK